MNALKPAPSKEHLLSINASHAVTPIDAERVRKLVPVSNDASINLNHFRYLPKKVQEKVDSEATDIQLNLKAQKKQAPERIEGKGKANKQWIDFRKVKCCSKTCLRNTPNPDKTLQLRSFMNLQLNETIHLSKLSARTATGTNIDRCPLGLKGNNF